MGAARRARCTLHSLAVRPHALSAHSSHHLRLPGLRFPESCFAQTSSLTRGIAREGPRDFTAQLALLECLSGCRTYSVVRTITAALGEQFADSTSAMALKGHTLNQCRLLLLLMVFLSGCTDSAALAASSSGQASASQPTPAASASQETATKTTGNVNESEPLP